MIVVYGIKDKLDPIKSVLSATIHDCMCEVLRLPKGKKSQRFVTLQRDDFFYPEDRSDAYTLIEINMMKGRKKETLKALIHQLFLKIEKSVGIAPLDIEIIIKEQEAYCWGFRGMSGDEAVLNYTIEK